MVSDWEVGATGGGHDGEVNTALEVGCFNDDCFQSSD